MGWAISLIVIIAAEMVGATAGLGYMVLEAQETFRTERVFAGIFVIGLIGLRPISAFAARTDCCCRGIETRMLKASDPTRVF